MWISVAAGLNPRLQSESQKVVTLKCDSSYQRAIRRLVAPGLFSRALGESKSHAG
jgi:hypothetical protein